ncbi:hypothetical protein F4680DRAFT_447704 [Xylaria scruposa]|nr:hypothetical protein F4680DRAFT_447704 [Xylaria scruposa]
MSASKHTLSSTFQEYYDQLEKRRYPVYLYFPFQMHSELGWFDNRSNIVAPNMRFDTIRTSQVVNRPPRCRHNKPVRLIVGRNLPLHEANYRAKVEVCEYHHERAHADGDMSAAPNLAWIRKAGTTDWPMTWKVENGRLRFSLIIDRGDLKFAEEIFVVESEGGPVEDGTNRTSASVPVPLAGRKRKRDNHLAA